MAVITKEWLENQIVATLQRLDNKEITPRQAEVKLKGLKLAMEYFATFANDIQSQLSGDAKIVVEVITRDKIDV